MDAVTELALVVEAIQCRFTGCVLWRDEGVENRARRELQGLTPNAIVDLLVIWVKANHTRVKQVRETREAFRDFYNFHYDVVLPIADYPRDLYIEMVIEDPPDLDCPEVVIVSAHLNYS
jgi:hypothetical protein